jgi:hypothetical protein
MTWEEFKKAVEQYGVKDDDKLDLIDVNFSTHEVTVHVSRDPEHGIAIS